MYSADNSEEKTQIADVYTTNSPIRCFLIQTYYTPFFTKIQAFCKKTDRFVDYDKIYVNIVMLTCSILKHLFLSFSIITTISSVFKAHASQNIVLEFFLSFLYLRVSISYSCVFFVHIHNHLFRLCLTLPLFSAQ